MHGFAMLGGLMALIVTVGAAAQDAAPPRVVVPSGSSEQVVTGFEANNAIGERYYLAPLLTLQFADNARDTDNGYGGQLAIGKKLGSAFAVEANGFYNRFSDNAAHGHDGAQLYGGGVSVLVSPIPTFRDVYAIGTAQFGVTKDLPNAQKSSYDSALLGAGLGYLFQLTPGGTALRTEVIYRLDDHKKDDANGPKTFEDIGFNIGLMIPFGRRNSAMDAYGRPVMVVAVADSDNDGVPNSVDQCPDTLPGAIVNAQGCEIDDDGDGVVNRLDHCPGTPAGTPVDYQGCPAAAAPPVTTAPPCKPPVLGQSITLDGCAASDTVVLQGVTFEYNRATLTTNAKTLLDTVADGLIAKPEIRVEIGGHTDSSGSAPYNLTLSEERAQSVLRYLVTRGVAATRMTARGYGKTMPIADNATDAGREMNRRVELRIVP